MTAEALAAAWASVVTTVGALAYQPPPPLPTSVFAEAAAGQVGRVKLPAGAVGVATIAAPRGLVWLSLTDDHLSDDVAGLTEIALEGRWSSPKLLYQRLDLPWPVNDRHWVLRLRNNERLAAACNTWERTWSMDNDRLPEARARTDAAAFDSALTMDENVGSWLLVSLAPDQTLAVYQVRVDLGGNIPADAADAYTRSSMSGFIRGVEAHVADVAAKYRGGCTPQPGGDGRPVPCLD